MWTYFKPAKYVLLGGHGIKVRNNISIIWIFIFHCRHRSIHNIADTAIQKTLLGMLNIYSGKVFTQLWPHGQWK